MNKLRETGRAASVQERVRDENRNRDEEPVDRRYQREINPAREVPSRAVRDRQFAERRNHPDDRSEKTEHRRDVPDRRERLRSTVKRGGFLRDGVFEPFFDGGPTAVGFAESGGENASDDRVVPLVGGGERGGEIVPSERVGDGGFKLRREENGAAKREREPNRQRNGENRRDEQNGADPTAGQNEFEEFRAFAAVRRSRVGGGCGGRRGRFGGVRVGRRSGNVRNVGGRGSRRVENGKVERLVRLRNVGGENRIRRRRRESRTRRETERRREQSGGDEKRDAAASGKIALSENQISERFHIVFERRKAPAFSCVIALLII